MPDEALIVQIENLLEQVIELGGQNERSQIVPNLTVQDANPTGLSNFIIVSDDRDGDNIIARKVPSVIYTNGDLVNVIFPKGTEAVAFQQGSGSSSGSIWSLVTGTTTDIYYNKGDVGIGKSVAPDARLELLDTAQPQLRLTFQEDTKFADFTLDTNHDLLIKTSSTGGFRYQPTTDQTDSFQILDADGGTPIFNVDSTNERIGINTALPSTQLNLESPSAPAGNVTMLLLEDSAGQSRSQIRNTGTQTWNLHSTVVESGQISFTTPGGNPGIVLWTGSPGSYVNRFDIINNGSTFTQKYNADSTGITIASGGNVGVGITTSPQGRVHGYDAISGFLHWEYDGLDGTSRTIIPNGAGDVLYELFGMYVLRDSSANTASGTFAVTNGGSTGLTVGGNTVTVAVAAAGTTTVSRTAGTDTIKVTFWLIWL